MKIFDAHCDVLYKLFANPTLDFSASPELQVNLDRLTASGTKVQLFAIYVAESVHPDLKFEAALRMTDLFYDRILAPCPQVKLIKNRQDIEQLGDHEIGAVLTLEGCDAIGQDLLKLRTLLRLGVRSVGLTWNYGNYAADGALEERGAGLSRFGQQVVQLLNETSTMCDVSHLSEKGFWDVMECASHVFASHSNSFKLCQHPRNLKDDQIKALIQRDSVMGITFVPEFLAGKKEAAVDDVLRHLDYVCSLGGEDHVGFGSDFDGIEFTVEQLSGNEQYANLLNQLQKYYSDIQVRKFLYDNMASRLPL
ncbi:dipeptidase [Mesobacillus subterraneus]|uniref:Membrane dipeptidase n=1 Tax=Mesobacillus subterraneus TaxID=285983 RepID=A0A427TUQ5_9BACI|nr:dipeptidase [Mesobacillus subterraneus]RSD27952.1 membrane dipeptidase [Mesobacillus subterraneus]